MKITAIKQQLKTRDRYSVYVDEQYSFSLGETALLDSGLHSGHELTSQNIEEYKKLSLDGKLYNRALRYVAMRQRSAWEMQTYLERKGADVPLVGTIIARLTELGLIDDYKLARAYVADRQLLRPTSRRKLMAELKKKRVAQAVIDEVLAEQAEASDGNADRSVLRDLIERKRRQTKYQDDLKLMQYLARQGFGYGDIKSALSADEDV
ncbi:MAG: RecX family transcriptional regulator [Candidatus Saccharimonadales bacterium]